MILFEKSLKYSAVPALWPAFFFFKDRGHGI